jgi:hypothetical protein
MSAGGESSAECASICCSGNGVCSSADGGTCVCDLGFGQPVGSAQAHGGAGVPQNWAQTSDRYCDAGDIGSYSTAAQAVSACRVDPSCLYVSDGGCDNSGDWETCSDSGSSSSAGSCMYQKSAVEPVSEHTQAMCWMNCSVAAAGGWAVGSRGATCDTVCGALGGACDDGDWEVTDRASFRLALSSAGEDADVLCDSYNDASTNAPVPLIYGSVCYSVSGGGSSSCSDSDSAYQRLCWCASVGGC